MLVRGVVHHHVHDDADLPLFGFGHQPVEIRHGAVLGIDRLVVGNVVTEIYLGRGIDGRQPDGVDAQALEVIEPLGDSVEVADTVAVRVLEAAGIDLVNDRMFPPGFTGSCGRLRRGAGKAQDEAGKYREMDRYFAHRQIYASFLLKAIEVQAEMRV